MKTFRKSAAAALTALFLLATAAPLRADPMPDFGDSVDFDESTPDLSLSRLKGKGVVIIFFQSWCPVCNEWGPKMLKQVEDTHGANRGLVLVAIKTDGGGVVGARNYLKRAGLDLTRWCVGSDSSAKYYQRVTGANELWDYALVGADGQLAKAADAGTFWMDGPEKNKYVVASSDTVKACGRIGTLLPADRKYPDGSDEAVRLAELGYFGSALKKAGDELKADIQAAAKKRVKLLIEVMDDKNENGGYRYEAYKDLVVLAKDLRGHAIGREAASACTRGGSDPVIVNEKTAEKAFHRAMDAVIKGGEKKLSKTNNYLKMVADRYKGTAFGDRAARLYEANRKK